MGDLACELVHRQSTAPPQEGVSLESFCNVKIDYDEGLHLGESGQTQTSSIYTDERRNKKPPVKRQVVRTLELGLKSMNKFHSRDQYAHSCREHDSHSNCKLDFKLR